MFDFFKMRSLILTTKNVLLEDLIDNLQRQKKICGLIKTDNDIIYSIIYLYNHSQISYEPFDNTIKNKKYENIIWFVSLYVSILVQYKLPNKMILGSEKELVVIMETVGDHFNSFKSNIIDR